MLNYVILSGSLGHDPEEWRGEGGPEQPAVTFSLEFHSAENRPARVYVVCGPFLAEMVKESLHRGDQVAVAGTVDLEPGGGLRLIARSVELIETDCRGNTKLTPLRPRASNKTVIWQETQESYETEVN
jgi:hypothetical protein